MFITSLLEICIFWAVVVGWSGLTRWSTSIVRAIWIFLTSYREIIEFWTVNIGGNFLTLMNSTIVSAALFGLTILFETIEWSTMINWGCRNTKKRQYWCTVWFLITMIWKTLKNRTISAVSRIISTCWINGVIVTVCMFITIKKVVS